MYKMSPFKNTIVKRAMFAHPQYFQVTKLDITENEINVEYNEFNKTEKIKFNASDNVSEDKKVKVYRKDEIELWLKS